MTGNPLETARLAWVWNPVPIGVVAMWAVIGVVGIVLLVRLRQDHFGVKLGASLLVVGGVALLLLCAAQREPLRRYYKNVNEVLAERDAIRSHRHELHVHGFIVPGSIVKEIDRDEYRFDIARNPGRCYEVIEARYTGLLPDMFRSGAEIVARGTLAPDGWLEVIPDGIVTKRLRD